MKFSFARILAVVLLLPALGFSGAGCSKIRTLVAKKKAADSPAPGATPTPGETSANASNPAEEAAKSGTSAGPVAPAVAPARPVAPGINKNAAVMVLCYHRLEDHPRPKDDLAITPQEFEREMQAIKDAQFSVIPMQDFLAWRRGDKEIPPKCCVITIDDGYISGYDTAWPILKKFGYPFTMFVYIHYINSGGKSVSWQQLEEMRDAGVDIQSHSYYHDNLRKPPSLVDATTMKLIQQDIQTLGMDGYMHKEIAESKQILEKRLGIKVNCLAYPYGNWSPKVRELVKEAGYEAAFTVYGQRLGYSTPPFDILGRYAVSQVKPQIFQDALAMQGGGTGGGLPADDDNQMDAKTMLKQPESDETISNPKPLIKANLATMGTVDPASLKMRISGIGEVKPAYNAANKNLSYQVEKPLTEKNITVIISATADGKPVKVSWDFIYDPAKAPVAKPATKP